MQQLAGILQTAGANNAQKLARITHLLGKYRAELLKDHVLSKCGTVVQHGPFAGMRLLPAVTEGCYLPKLLGSYEAELHAAIGDLVQTRYECVVNIGCAEGYYTVGFARLLPAAEVFAYDLNPTAQRFCRRLAEINHVSDRVHIGGLFSPADFARFEGRRTLVICDIEGAELELLDPLAAPSLAGFDLLVEMHDLGGRAVSAHLLPRFQQTHAVELIAHGGRDTARFPALKDLSQFNQFIALWEWRSGPTPWAILRSRQPAGTQPRALEPCAAGGA
jgi:hypothetical protein